MITDEHSKENLLLIFKNKKVVFQILFSQKCRKSLYILKHEKYEVSNQYQQ